jgi:hypothetical protein
MTTPRDRVNQWMTNKGLEAQMTKQSIEMAVGTLLGSGHGYDEIVEMSDEQLDAAFRDSGIVLINQLVALLDQAPERDLADPLFRAVLERLGRSIREALARS